MNRLHNKGFKQGTSEILETKNGSALFLGQRRNRDYKLEHFM